MSECVCKPKAIMQVYTLTTHNTRVCTAANAGECMSENNERASTFPMQALTTLRGRHLQLVPRFVSVCVQQGVSLLHAGAHARKDR